MIDLGRALRAPFEDPDWISKTLLSFVWGLLGILFFPLLAVFTGAELEYMRRVSRGQQQLPDWSQFGKRWSEGLVVWVATFLYFLPVFVLGAMAFLPSIIAAVQNREEMNAGLLVGTGCIYLVLALVYTLIVSILFQAAVVNYAMRGTFGSLFAFGEIAQRVRGRDGYWAAWAMSIAISFGMSAATSALSGTVVGILLYPAALYLGTMMTAHVLGQWAKASYLGGEPAGYVPAVLRREQQATPTPPSTTASPPPPVVPPERPVPVSPPPPPDGGKA